MITNEEILTVSEIVNRGSAEQRFGVIMATLLLFSAKELDELRSLGRGEHPDDMDPKLQMIFRSIAGLAAIAREVEHGS